MDRNDGLYSSRFAHFPISEKRHDAQARTQRSWYDMCHHASTYMRKHQLIQWSETNHSVVLLDNQLIQWSGPHRWAFVVTHCNKSGRAFFQAKPRSITGAAYGPSLVVQACHPPGGQTPQLRRFSTSQCWCPTLQGMERVRVHLANLIQCYPATCTTYNYAKLKRSLKLSGSREPNCLRIWFLLYAVQRPRKISGSNRDSFPNLRTYFCIPSHPHNSAYISSRQAPQLEGSKERS